MNLAIWIATGLLVFTFLVGGLVKAFASRDKQKDMGLNYVEDIPENTIRLIGGLELLAVAGLLLPALTGTATFLVPLAALGLALTMVGAMYVHYRRGETNEIVKPFGLMVVALFITVMRFGPERL